MVLASTHVIRPNPTDARIGMMLADNVLELVLHRVAENGASAYGRTVFRPYPGIDEAIWRKALGKNFDDKVRLAVKIGMVSDEVAITLRTCHEFRNELYHVGLQHEPILPTLARFHLRQVCEVLQLFETNRFSYSPGMQPPDRAKPYFTGDPFNVLDFLVQFRSACAQIASTSAHDTGAFISALESHMKWTIDDVDRSLNTISDNGPRKTSRDEAVLQSQAWKIAFTDEGKRFAVENGAESVTVLQYALWIAEHYPFQIRRDPISGWRERLRRLAAEKNPHRALAMYRSFHSDTETFRQVIDESATAAEAWIDDQIARARGN